MSEATNKSIKIVHRQAESVVKMQNMNENLQLLSEIAIDFVLSFSNSFINNSTKSGEKVASNE